MAMNIPAPVQILRYDIPENTTFEQAMQHIYETIKDGMLLIVNGDVVLGTTGPRETPETAHVGLFIVGTKYNGIVTPTFVPMLFGKNGIGIELNTDYAGQNFYSSVITDIFPHISSNNDDSPFSDRGLLIGAVRRTNIDNISEYGIYWPSEDSTFPDGIDSSDCYVLHYADNGMNSRHFQFFMCPETSTPGSISDYHVLVYTRFSNISYPLGPKDWSPWQPLGGGSSLTAGDGISITDDAVAVDDTVVRTEGEQAINGSLRVWHYASAAVTVSKKDTDDNVYAKLSPNNLYFRFGNNARDFVSITSGGTASSMGNSTYARLTAHNDATMSSAILSVHATDEGMYATAPSTRSTPVDNEIITYDYFRDHAVTLRTGNIYVDNVNGSDSNDGLTADTALATFDAAIALRQKVKFYDPSTNDELVTINLAASTTPYTYSKNTIPTNTAIVGAASDSTTIQLYSELRGVNTRLQFANITLDFVQISNLIVALLYFLTSTVSFIYCTIRKSTNSNIENLLYTGDSGYTYMENTVIDIGDNDNNFEQLIYTNNTSSIIMLSTIITGSGLISYSTVRCNSTSNIFINGLNSTSASLNAKRYDVTLGSGIFVNNAGENAIPGTLPGSVDDTSWYK